jgi:hypothetical protein
MNSGVQFQDGVADEGVAMPPTIDKPDAYHEAGHAVIGVVLGFRLEYAAGQTKEAGPRCKRLPHGISNVDQGSSEDEIMEATGRTRDYALMCMASEFAEALVAD